MSLVGSEMSIRDMCIDCGVCEPECPAGAIFADTDIDPARGDEFWLEMNDKYSRGKWPVITQQKDPMPDADSFNPEMGYQGKKGKFLITIFPCNRSASVTVGWFPPKS